jgi:hypothetical protein
MFSVRSRRSIASTLQSQACSVPLSFGPSSAPRWPAALVAVISRPPPRGTYLLPRHSEHTWQMCKCLKTIVSYTDASIECRTSAEARVTSMEAFLRTTSPEPRRTLESKILLASPVILKAGEWVWREVHFAGGKQGTEIQLQFGCERTTPAPPSSAPAPPRPPQVPPGPGGPAGSSVH